MEACIFHIHFASTADVRRDRFTVLTIVPFERFFAIAACLNYDVMKMKCQSSDLDAWWQKAGTTRLITINEEVKYSLGGN